MLHSYRVGQTVDKYAQVLNILQAKEKCIRLICCHHHHHEGETADQAGHSQSSQPYFMALTAKQAIVNEHIEIMLCD